jgi:hypothetical protein
MGMLTCKKKKKLRTERKRSKKLRFKNLMPSLQSQRKSLSTNLQRFLNKPSHPSRLRVPLRAKSPAPTSIIKSLPWKTNSKKSRKSL